MPFLCPTTLLRRGWTDGFRQELCPLSCLPMFWAPGGGCRWGFAGLVLSPSVQAPANSPGPAQAHPRPSRSWDRQPLQQGHKWAPATLGSLVEHTASLGLSITFSTQSTHPDAPHIHPPKTRGEALRRLANRETRGMSTKKSFANADTELPAAGAPNAPHPQLQTAP